LFISSGASAPPANPIDPTLVDTYSSARRGGGILSDSKKAGKPVSLFVAWAPDISPWFYLRSVQSYSDAFENCNAQQGSRLRRKKKRTTKDDEAGLDEGGKRATGE
jgi:hypothetical protein